MRLGGGLPVILVGAAIAIVQPLVAIALTSAEVYSIAQKITVRIDGANTGSGIIIERTGDTYTVVTNWHVMGLKGDYIIRTEDGRQHNINHNQVKQLGNVDLAVFQFTSNQNYPVADKGNSDQLTGGKTVYVAGYPTGISGVSGRNFKFLSGQISSLLSNPKDGYALDYTVQSFKGMSGGPILDEQGKLVGIHGRAGTDPIAGGTAVLGIPLKTYLTLAPSAQLVATAPAPKPKNPSVSSASINTDIKACINGRKLLKASSKELIAFIINPKEFIDEVWQVVQRQYVDNTFNQLDWGAVRKEYLSKTYSSLQEGCQSAQEMLKRLGDPYTKLINPEEFQKMQIGVSRELLDIGIQGRIEIEPVEYSQKQTEFGKVGYIRLKQFSTNASQKMQNAIKDLESKQVVGYVLDLRGNPGGLLLSSVEIAKIFLDKGTIFIGFDRTGEQDREVANGRALTSKPLVILVNQDSAGASEILSGALQDNKRAVLVGTRTFGKGKMQYIRPLENGSALSISILKSYAPSGRNIDKQGIIPDVNLELTEAQQRQLSSDRQKIATSYDPHYTRALSILRTKIADQGN